MDPKESYASAVLQRFCSEPSFSDVLTGLAKCIETVVLEQKSALPAFTFVAFTFDANEHLQ